MRELALVVAVVAGMVALPACTVAQAKTAADIIRELAPEVCVEGDTVSVCLRKCEAAASEEGILEAP
jgi:hypothetical protein